MNVHSRRNKLYEGLEELAKSKTQKELASIFGVSQAAISIRLKSVAIEHDADYQEELLKKKNMAAQAAHQARREKSNQKWEGYDLVEMYKTMTQAHIAEKIGVSQVRVSQKLRELGIRKK